jgi:hypothetical protein
VIRLHFTPPFGDAAWDAWMEDGRAAATRMLADATGSHSIDAALYKRQRDRLLAATHGKCAYCELKLAVGQRKGDVEHYRPKGRARARDGKVVKIQRDGVEIDHPGYFWLAYDYMNLLPSCSACNRRAGDAASGTHTGKSDIFPTLDERWAARPEDVSTEQPALLNPWLESDDPAKHLLFDPDTGLVIGTTARGTTTVWLLGLNRDGLPEERLKACRDVRRAFQVSVSEAVHDGADEDDVLHLKSVMDGSGAFAAICRVELERRRQQLKELLAHLDPRVVDADHSPAQNE